MAEYIEREAVLKLFDKVGCYLNPKCLERQKEDIEKLPTADVVPVVRCKDCNQSFQRYDHTLLQLWWCDKWKNIMRGCDYCSFGERRDIK